MGGEDSLSFLVLDVDTSMYYALSVRNMQLGLCNCCQDFAIGDSGEVIKIVDLGYMAVIYENSGN